MNLFHGPFLLLGFLTLFASPILGQDFPSIQPSRDPGHSLIFDTEHITEARSLVERVDWSEAVIDAQYADTRENPVWVETVKTALLGGTDRMEATLSGWEGAMEQALETDSLPLFDSLALLQSYDALRALPEWTRIPLDRQRTLRTRIEAFAEKPLDPGSYPSDDTAGGVVFVSSYKVYANLISGATVALATDALQPGSARWLVRLVEREMAAEGLLPGATSSYSQTFSDSLEACRVLHIAAAAVQSVSPGLHEPLKPWLKKSSDLLANLLYPNGRWPMGIQPSKSGAAAEVLERGYMLFGSPIYAYALNKFYDHQARKGEALLYGAHTLKPRFDQTSPSTAYPQTGFAVLRQETAALPLSVFVDTGVSRFGGVSALLGLDIFSKDSALTASGDEPERFNTLLVDGETQPLPTPEGAVNGLIYSMRTMPDGAYLRVKADNSFSERKAYEQAAYYDRSLFLQSPFVVDCFRATGGSTHEYQYTFSSSVKSVTNIDGFTVGSPVSVQGTYAVVFAPNQDGIGERLWVIDPAGSELSVTTRNGKSTLSLRRQSENTADLYTVVHEFYRSEPNPTTRVEPLALQPGGNERDFQAVGLAVKSATATDLFLSATNNETEYTATYQGNRLVFQGIWGRLQFENGAFKALHVGGGTQMRYGVHSVKPKLPMIHGYVRATNQAEGSLDVDFIEPLPEGDVCGGHSVMALASSPLPVMYQSLIVDRIPELQEPQKLVLRSVPNFSRTPLRMGFPIPNGTTLIYESYVALHRKNQDAYEMVLNTPTDFMIEGRPDRKRILYPSALYGYKKTMGEFKVGAIFGHFEPEEAYRGSIEFRRMGGLPPVEAPKMPRGRR